MMFKRTGWQVVKYDTFVDIFPLDDLQEHAVGDECWCNPRVVREHGYMPRIAHNSADKREFDEPDHWQENYITI